MIFPITVLIVHYGDRQPTVDCARRVIPLVESVLVVSNDGESFSELGDGVRTVHSPTNVGFGAAVNLGMQYVTTPYTLLLNTDVTMSERTLSCCIELLSEKTVGAVGPLLNYPDGRPQSGAGVRDNSWNFTKQEFTTELKRCDWVTGAALFTKTRILKSFPMDGSFFLGYEDYDFCRRIAELGGYDIIWTPEVSEIHGNGLVIGPILWNYYATRNPIWYARSNYGELAFFVKLFRSSFRVGRVLLADLFKRHDFRFLRGRHALLGIRDSVRSKPSLEEGPWCTEPAHL